MDYKKGNVLVTKDGRKWTIDSFDGRYIYTREGSQFAPSHPDILRFEDGKKEYVHEEKEESKEEVKTYFSKKKHK